MLNRRHFFAVSLPALLGSMALRAPAKPQSAPGPVPQKLKPRRVKIEVALLNSALTPGCITARVTTVITDEDVAAYASFLQVYTFEDTGNTAKSQAFGPFLQVTPHVEADGRITLDAKIQFEEATALTAPPDRPLTVSSNSLATKRSMESGQSVTLGGLTMGSEQKQVQLTATLLPPAQTA